MSPKDPWAKTHPSSYYNHLLQTKTLDLVKTYSIHPPDNAGGANSRGVETATWPHTVQGKRDLKLARMFNQKVAYLNLTKRKRSRILSTKEPEGAGVLYGEATYTSNQTYVPVYWLPWDEGGGVVSLTIPKKGTRGQGEPDPDLFFTAAINGCSIFFREDPDSPTVYHCGGDTFQKTPTDGATFWRNIIEDITKEKNLKEVSKVDYIKQDDEHTKSGRSLTTKLAKAYRKWLEDEYSKKLEIETVSPWGCVFGIRDSDGNWKFYLQKNASVRYYVLTKQAFSSERIRKKEYTMPKGRDGKYKKARSKPKVDMQRTVARPICVHEVFPKREVGGYIDSPIPTSKHG